VYGQGEPAQLHIGKIVRSVDADNARILLEDGETIKADLIIGADGVHSRCRAAIPNHSIQPAPAVFNAFRFLVPVSQVTTDPRTAQIVEALGSMDMYYQDERKVVIYPCVRNTLLNFVCIYPASLFPCTSDNYSRPGSKDMLLEVFHDFAVPLLDILRMCDEKELKLYPLLDMDTMPDYVSGRLALLGDAAHPFTPHLAQGGAMAMEDGVCLGVLLSQLRSADEVPDRLRLYSEARYERATTIQNFSRLVGHENSDGGDNNQIVDNWKGINFPAPSTRPLKTLTWLFLVTKYLEYGFSHDEFHASTQRLREYQWQQRTRCYWRQPTVFGPLPGPRQDLWNYPRPNGLLDATSTVATIRFRTSGTLLRNLLPSAAYSFILPDTVAEASVCVQSIKNLPWLSGKGYDLVAFYFHGLQYQQQDGSVVRGSFIPVLFENLTDPILTGREELGWPKLFSDIEIRQSSDAEYQVQLSWNGVQWASISMTGLQEQALEQTAAQTGPEGQSCVLVHKFMPTTTRQPRREMADADYTVAVSVFPPVIRQRLRATTAKLSVMARSEQELPTLHPIVKRLAELPVFDILEATLDEVQGMDDFSTACRIE
jgi:2-polyprenyl-6-methoxyphenol hydroxylase-like FAD-dependent oxidoreductase